jgi:hypothetical protein
MITSMAGHSAPLVIGGAAFLAVFGLLAWRFSRRKGDRYAGWVLLVGLPGLYLAFLASLGVARWLYIPGLGLLASSYVMQVVSWRRQRADQDAGSPGPDGHA